MCAKDDALAARERASHDLYQACCASAVANRLRQAFPVPETTPADLSALARALDNGGHS